MQCYYLILSEIFSAESSQSFRNLLVIYDYLQVFFLFELSELLLFFGVLLSIFLIVYFMRFSSFKSSQSAIFFSFKILRLTRIFLPDAVIYCFFST